MLTCISDALGTDIAPVATLTHAQDEAAVWDNVTSAELSHGYPAFAQIRR